MVLSGEAESGDLSPVSIPAHRTSCDLCKRMKIKCERRGGDRCVHCIERGSKCETTLVERKKRQGKGGMSLTEMESRIKRLEAVITDAGLDSRMNETFEQGATTHSTPDVDNTNDRLSSLIIDDQGVARYIGPSSGFSLFSLQGLQWISQKTGSNEVSQVISDLFRTGTKMQNPWTKGQTDMWHTLSPSEREPLPPKDVADHCVKSYFETFNTIMPLFDKDSFYKHYDRQYGDATPAANPAWYASLNIVIALGGAFYLSLQPDRGSNIPASEKIKIFGEDQHWKYFRNACSCFVDLLFKESDLMAVQAICAMAFFMQMTFQPQAYHILIAAAARLAHGIGLHRKLDEFGLSQSEIKQRNNVYWLIYIMDKKTALRIGHPPVINDEDIGVDLPEEDTTISYFPDGSRMFDTFRCVAQLAVHEGRVYSELYSIASRNKSDLERLKAVGRLDKELQSWLLTVPVDIRPHEKIRCAQEHGLPVVMLHLAYFNCLGAIHRGSIHNASWTNEGLNESARSAFPTQDINPRVYSSQSISLTAARSTINMLKEFDSIGIFSASRCVWIEVYYPLWGFLTLFANTLQNPKDAQVESDLELMDLVVSFLDPILGQVSPLSLPAAVKLFHELAKVARALVEKTKKSATKSTKRGYAMDGLMDDNSESDVRLYQAGPGGMNAEASDHTHLSGIPHSMNDDVYRDPQPLIAGIGMESQEQYVASNDTADFLSMNFDVPLFADYFGWDPGSLWVQDPTTQDL